MDAQKTDSIIVVDTDKALVRIHPGKSYENTIALIKQGMLQYARKELRNERT